MAGSVVVRKAHNKMVYVLLMILYIYAKLIVPWLNEWERHKSCLLKWITTTSSGHLKTLGIITHDILFEMGEGQVCRTKKY